MFNFIGFKKIFIKQIFQNIKVKNSKIEKNNN